MPHSLIRRKELGSGPVLGFGARLWEAHVQSCQGYICFRIYFCLPMECATSVVLQLSHAAHHFLREKFSPGLTHSHTKPFSPTHFLLWLPKEEPFCPQAESHSTHGTDSIRPFQTWHTAALSKTAFPLVKSSDWKSSAGDSVAEQTPTVAPMK